MNEELNTSDGNSQESATASTAELNHIYYEIESDLLAKPNSLADILITNPQPTVVFCNQPSEADLLEVILNKRQISCRKLIGRVPTSKVQATATQVVDGEIQVLIVTDISGRELDCAKFTRLVNYAIHEDPEVYIHRTLVTDSQSKLRTIINLISPLDHGNFHYLKKVIDFEIKQVELPSSSEIHEAQFKQIIAEAKSCAYSDSVSKSLDELVTNIKASADYDALLKYFIHNTLNVLPEMKVKASSASSGFNNRRGDRNERGDRSERGGDRDQQDNNSRDDYKDLEARIISRNIPKIEYCRFYVGSDNAADIDETKITKLMNEAANMPVEHLAKYTARGAYAFVDVLKENAAGLIDILDGFHLDSGEKLIFKKAATIYIKADQPEGTAAPEQASKQQGNSDEEE